MCRSLCGKAQLLRQLRVRAGFPVPFTGPFEFRGEEPAGETPRWMSVEQLEAVVEFYANLRPAFQLPLPPDYFGDPWNVNAQPTDESDPNYIRVNLGVIEGTAATIA